ncbi:hypothetical protein FBZ98_10651 [Rhizobium sp. ERR 922]|uniref:hypothetical protein n=1 Tax=unclassified Rhizobium TaxID=2613769 RepID=UPI0011AAB5A7|nr:MULTISPECIES: hypothetical protein [unclassified Rhizobium]TWB50069.1 hypothetical protein FBZ98_10651 [Rhizobium sp. ERR 922]TWB92450.1 hypothetical protein FBZ97_10651 [Rhizobium sp. ERR 942]
MRQAITRIKGLTVNIEVVEVYQTDQHGGILCYVATIYIQAPGSADKRLVRKSRLPGAATALKAEIKRDGLRAFDRMLVNPDHRQPRSLHP